MYLKALKTGFLGGAIYGAIFLFMEDLSGIILYNAQFTFKQILFSVIIYLMFFILLGMLLGTWQYVIKFRKKNRNSISIDYAQIVLFLFACAFLIVAFEPVAWHLLRPWMPRAYFVVVSWLILIFIIFYLASLIIKKATKNDLTKFQIFTTSICFALTFLLIIFIKIENNLEINSQFDRFIPYWPQLFLIATLGMWLIGREFISKLYFRFSLAKKYSLRYDSIILGIGLVLLAFWAGAVPLNLLKNHKPTPKYACTPSSPPNVILIVLDACRPDYLGPYGYKERSTTPVLDRYAEKEAIFYTAYSMSSITKQSMGALCTSRFTEMNDAFKLQEKFSNDLVFLPEILQQNGYYTALFSSNIMVSRLFNLAQGFEEANNMNGSGGKQLLISNFLLLKSWLLLEWAYNMDLVGSELFYATDINMNRQILPWLKKNKNQLFYLQIHYMDTHSRTFPSKRVYSKHKNMKISDLAKIRKFRDLGKDFQIDPIFKDKFISRYDDAILQFDEQLGELFRTLEELHLWDKTIIVFTADHGEEFAERGRFGHGQSLFEEAIRVPLICFLPSSEFQGKKIEEPVTHLDLMPTILDYLKIKSPSKLEGASLLPLLAGDTSSYRRQRKLYYGYLNLVGESWRFYLKKAIIEGNYKFIRRYTKKGIKEQLFDLKLDPEEKANLCASLPEMQQRLSSIMDEYSNYCDSLAELLKPESEATIPGSVYEQLKALVYVK